MIGKKPYIITIVGPESSGKTTLARQLAAELGCPWVPEYAREYLQASGGYYDEADLDVIAEGQMAVISEQLAVGSEQSSVFSEQSSVGSQQFSVISTQMANVSRDIFAGGLNRVLEKKDVLTFYREEFGDEPRPIVIIDSGMISIRMWAKIKYNKTIPVVEEALREDVTSMYI